MLNEQKKNVYSKIMGVSIDLYNLKLAKTGHNSFLKFSYYELSDFLPQLYKLCYNAGLCIKIDILNTMGKLTIIDVENGEQVEFIHEFHGDTGQADKMDIIQREGCISTYMRRYLLINAFGIVEPETLDNTNYTMATNKRSTKTKKTDNSEVVTKHDNEDEENKNERSINNDITPYIEDLQAKIDMLQIAPNKEACADLFRYCNKKGLTKEVIEKFPALKAQYKRLLAIWFKVKEGDEVKERSI